MKNIEDYEFIKIGQAKLSDMPIVAKGTSGDYRLIINLIDEKFLHAEQSAYLVYVEDELIYAGYYSGSFQDRWLRKQNGQYYCWHSDKLDDEINALVKKNKNVSVWLTINPYATLKNGEKVNISKFIEDTIIMKLKPKLNKVGKYLEENKKNTLSVEEITRGLRGI
jgi:hypothetical protein